MASSIALTCDEPAVRAALNEWVVQGHLDPASPVALDVRIAEPLPAPIDGQAVFRQPGVVVRTGPPDGVHISWLVAPAVAVLPPATCTARVTLSPLAATRMNECLRGFFLPVLIFLLRRTGWHHIHAATAVDPRQRGWLIAGNAHAGKSTTAALLASRGWQIGGDDIAFLAGDRDGVSVVAYRAPIALRTRGREMLHRPGGAHLPERRKVGYWPEDLGGRWIPRVEPEIILFTSVGNGATLTHAEPLERRQALAELIRWSAWVILEPDLAQQHLDVLAQLASQARSYRVTLGRDLFANPSRLADLVQ